MIPTPHPRVTRRFGPPVDWDPEVHGQCATLEIADIIDEGRPSMESLWQPSPDELAALLVGRPLRLRIQGTTHPVVSIAVLAVDG